MNVNFLDATAPTTLGKIDDVLIMVSGNYVPVDFKIMDLDFKLPCPIVLGRPFLRTVGVVIVLSQASRSAALWRASSSSRRRDDPLSREGRGHHLHRASLPRIHPPG